MQITTMMMMMIISMKHVFQMSAEDRITIVMQRKIKNFLLQFFLQEKYNEINMATMLTIMHNNIFITIRLGFT